MKPRPARIEPGPGQESVWDYPRPPRVEDTPKRIQVIFNGVTVADSRRAKRVLETAGAPVYYIPLEDIRTEFLEPVNRATFCEWKGQAAYYGLKVNGRRVESAGWYYPNPTPNYRELKNYVAFYCRPMDTCLVDGEVARPQPGGFYGGWITSEVVGPFKGEPGSEGW